MFAKPSPACGSAPVVDVGARKSLLVQDWGEVSMASLLRENPVGGVSIPVGYAGPAAKGQTVHGTRLTLTNLGGMECAGEPGQAGTGGGMLQGPVH